MSLQPFLQPRAQVLFLIIIIVTNEPVLKVLSHESGFSTKGAYRRLGLIRTGRSLTRLAFSVNYWTELGRELENGLGQCC